MTEEERIKTLVAQAPRPTREQITKLALLLAGSPRPDERIVPVEGRVA